MKVEMTSYCSVYLGVNRTCFKNPNFLQEKAWKIRLNKVNYSSAWNDIHIEITAAEKSKIVFSQKNKILRFLVLILELFSPMWYPYISFSSKILHTNLASLKVLHIFRESPIDFKTLTRSDHFFTRFWDNNYTFFCVRENFVDRSAVSV